jgi:transposase InsO family protein
MRRDILQHVSHCVSCDRNRAPNPKRKAEMQLLIANSRFDLVYLDITGGGNIPKTERGNKYIPVLVDHFARYCEAIPLANQQAETIANVFFENWIMRYGAPMRVHADQGANFESTLFSELCAKLHVQKSRTMAYHPRSNGTVERLNRTLISMLRTCACGNPKSWDLRLPEIVFVYNTRPHSSTSVTPYSQESMMKQDM